MYLRTFTWELYFRNISLEIYALDPAKLFSAPELAWQATLGKTKVKLDLLTDTITLFRVEKVIREGIFHSVYKYAKASNKYMKDYDKKRIVISSKLGYK